MLMVWALFLKNGTYLTSGIRANVRTKMVIAVGACASSGGIFDTYSTLQGIDKDTG
jgi:NADH-quinone oxidoreductase subunit B